ncbi:hypothetical protein Pmani_005508 [Petrolisthes manimaculis]|uniref:Uncharacterized protein n=1 Tax=Petrolisthes manimaculis TaxID=1843537 RepID=A0AAE1UHE9_9EUCA|nr:hypothetical protein Pmani_005508 [Petrolisthes manimaculis]
MIQEPPSHKLSSIRWVALKARVGSLQRSTTTPVVSSFTSASFEDWIQHSSVSPPCAFTVNRSFYLP